MRFLSISSICAKVSDAFLESFGRCDGQKTFEVGLAVGICQIAHFAQKLVLIFRISGVLASKPCRNDARGTALDFTWGEIDFSEEEIVKHAPACD